MRVLLLLVVGFIAVTNAANSEYQGDKFVENCLKDAATDVDNALSATKQNKNNNPKQTAKALFDEERYPSKDSLRAARGEEIVERTIKCVLEKVNKRHGSADVVRKVLSPTSISLINEEAGCSVVRYDADCSDQCFHSKYRTIDGTCNNLYHPTWAASRIPFNRLVLADYENGFNEPRGWTKGKLYNGFPLPSAREVSTKVASAKKLEDDNKFTYMLMQWGQFLDHDIDLSPVNPVAVSIENGTDCSETSENDMPCFPIPIPEDDERIKNTEFMEFVRTSATCGSGGSIMREQINDITSYIDASNVYGSIKAINDRLRDETNKEFLKKGDEVIGHPDKYLLPFDSGEFAGCEKDPATNTPCFLAGDKRANEQLGLTTMHMLFMREHNRIASELKSYNPQMQPEQIYQEARKIVGAIAQVITYEHWLPLILGPEGMDLMGDYEGYDPYTNAAITNVFATAAYRFGHGLVNPQLQRLDENFQESNEYPNLLLHKAFFAPHRMVHEGGIDYLIRGLFGVAAKKMDSGNMLNTELTESLFKLAHQVAFDLAALNIQRGRDHGLPTYVEMRKHCKLGGANTFDDLKGFIKNKVLKALEHVYGDPRNIDLFIGGLAEELVSGAKVGPTFLCILVEQFRRLRDGDRFFYRNPGVFTSDQLAEIRKASMARIICDNGDDIKRVQPNVFRRVKSVNDYISCSDYKRIPQIDLTAWKEDGCPGYPSLIKQDKKFNSKNEKCCCGNVYENSNLLCCQDKLYDPDTDSCCQGELYCGRPGPLYKCCGKSIFNTAQEECEDGMVEKIGTKRMCGKNKYDTETHVCCGNTVSPKKSKISTCCGKKSYNPKEEICCEGELLTPPSRQTQCCGKITYEPSTEICCLNIPKKYAVQPRPAKKGTIGYCNVEFTYENPYDIKKDGCCCGAILYGYPFGKRDSCCGTGVVDLSKEMCCDGTAVTGDVKVMKCCGQEGYRPNRQSCCKTSSGYLVVDGQGNCPNQGTSLCNGAKYDQTEEICCEGNVHPGGPTISCCGNVAYNTEWSNCCPDSQCKFITSLITVINADGVCPKDLHHKFDP